MKSIMNNKNAQALALIAVVLAFYLVYKDFYTGEFSFYDRNGEYHRWTKVNGTCKKSGDNYWYDLKYTGDLSREEMRVSIRINKNTVDEGLVGAPIVNFRGETYISFGSWGKNAYRLGLMDIDSKGIYHDDYLEVELGNYPLKTRQFGGDYIKGVSFEFHRSNNVWVLTTLLGFFAISWLVRKSANITKNP